MQRSGENVPYLRRHAVMIASSFITSVVVSAGVGANLNDQQLTGHMMAAENPLLHAAETVTYPAAVAVDALMNQLQR